MVFTKVTEDEEAEALREALAAELEEPASSPDQGQGAEVSEPNAFTSRPKISKKTLFKGAVVVALIVGSLWLVNRWATPPAAMPVSYIEVRLDGDGYWIEGVQVSDLVDGAPVFFERAQLAERGAVPGTTVIQLDAHNAPEAAADHFRRELEARGFRVEVVEETVVVEFSARHQAVED